MAAWESSFSRRESADEGSRLKREDLATEKASCVREAVPTGALLPVWLVGEEQGAQRDARVRQQPHGQEVQLNGEGSSRRVARWPRGRQRLMKKELNKQTKVGVCI